MLKANQQTSRQRYQKRKQAIKDEVSRNKLVRMMWINFYALIYSEGKKVTGPEGRQPSGETGQERFI